ncbi:MAG: DUF3179 domain-containing protein [Trueperaceae bacterium]|nr:DUF3179 domain-containing protein [Trueperaceae bacterium]
MTRHPRPTRTRRRWSRTLAVTGLALMATSALAISELTLRGLRVPTERAILPIEDILSGGPPPQGIPAIGFRGLTGVAEGSPDPVFVTQEAATEWLGDLEPVILMRVGGEARLYPLQVLTWHEIANDTLAGVPIAVTFCPLCNSALAFDRRVLVSDEQLAALRAPGNTTVRVQDTPADLAAAFARQTGREAPSQAVDVTFGVSGLLYHSNLLMFDDTTFTLWSQLTGEGGVGELTGEVLVRYPAQIVGFADARAAEPEALVLSRDTGFNRAYGRNPYVGYDEIGSPAFLFRGTADGRLEPKARVITVDGAEPVAYSFDHLAATRVVHDDVGGAPLVLLWDAGTATALGAAVIANAADVGSVGVFRPEADGRRLTFTATADGFVDAETGSLWDVTGRARSGPLAGQVLEAVAHDNTLWFAWAAFRPETEIRRPAGAEGN